MEESICKRCENARICGKAIIDNKNVIMTGCSRFKERKPVEYNHLRQEGNMVHLPLTQKQLDDAIDLYDRMRHPLTNRDRFLAMTDEELAEFLYVKTCEDGYPQFDTTQGWLEWLKEEVKE